MSDQKNTNAVSGAFHGEGDTDASVVTDSVTNSGKAGDALNSVDGQQDEPGELSKADIENQAGTEVLDTEKFQRDSAEGQG